jgi:hypothetical protein
LYGLKDDYASDVPTTAELGRSAFLNDANSILVAGRIQMVVLALGLGLLIYGWSRVLFGVFGGTLSLVFFCFDPNFIAHGSLVTTDVAVSLCFFGSIFFFWRLGCEITWANLFGFAFFIGTAFVAKFSSVLLLPILTLLAAVRISSGREWFCRIGAARPLRTRKVRAAVTAGILIVAGLTTYVLIWSAYGFHYSAAKDLTEAQTEEQKVASLFSDQDYLDREPAHFPVKWVLRRGEALQNLLSMSPKQPTEDEILRKMAEVELGPIARLVLFTEHHKLLPEAYLFGIASLSMNSVMRGAFLLGRYSITGFRTYFVSTFLLKTPLLTLCAIGAGLYFAIRRGRLDAFSAASLLAPPFVYFLFSIGSHLNIGHRHLLPILPFLFVSCGANHVWLERWRFRASLKLAGVAALAAVNANVVFAPPWKPAWVFPHYLSYFNELAGGPRLGYKALVDSNFDWGQDLPYLKKWLLEHHVSEPINLCYFGMADPKYYQISYINLHGGCTFEPQVPLSEARRPGYLAISATNLQAAAYVSPKERSDIAQFARNADLIDRVGYSIFIYKLPALP